MHERMKARTGRVACRLCRTGGACSEGRFAPQQHHGGGAHSERRYVYVPQQHRAGGAHSVHRYTPQQRCPVSHSQRCISRHALEPPSARWPAPPHTMANGCERRHACLPSTLMPVGRSGHIAAWPT